MSAKIFLIDVRLAVPIVWLAFASILVAADAAKGAKSVTLGERIRHEQFALEEGFAVIREGVPGIAFGLSQMDRQKVHVSYIVIFKNDYTSTRSKAKFDLSLKSKPGLFQATCTAEINSAMLTIVHQIGGAKGETVTVGDETFQAAKGRVFLVDLTAEMPSVHQLKINLPAQAVARERKESEVEAIAEDVLAEIMRKNDSVKKFVAPGKP